MLHFVLRFVMCWPSEDVMRVGGGEASSMCMQLPQLTVTVLLRAGEGGA